MPRTAKKISYKKANEVKKLKKTPTIENSPTNSGEHPKKIKLSKISRGFLEYVCWVRNGSAQSLAWKLDMR